MVNFTLFHHSVLASMVANDSERQIHRIALSEVVAYSDEMTIQSSDKMFFFFFKSSELKKKKHYCQCLKELGMEVQGRIYSTGLIN